MLNILRSLETKNVKKMFSKNKKILKKDLFTFTPPVRHDGKSSYISFQMIDPVSGKLKRKKYMLDRYRKGRERDLMSSQIMSNIYLKLMNGWNPWIDTSNTRGNIELTTVIQYYVLYIDNLLKKKVITEKTSIDWNSRVSILEKYLYDFHREHIMAFQIDRSFIVDYLDYVLMDRDVSARTRNNHRTWMSTFCSWMKDKGYIEDNPVSNVPILAEHDKFREPLSKSALHKLSDYLTKKDKHFLLAVMMEYYTFIRPTELSKIRLKDISIKQQTVFVSSDISKNRRNGMVALNDKIVKLMMELRIFSRPGNNYLFGRKFTPSETPATAAIFRNEFAKVRKELGFPDKYQFYSLKDSGIRDLANAQGIVVARDQARHSDISTTNKYLQGKDMIVDETTKHFDGDI
jgi:integrase